MTKNNNQNDKNNKPEVERGLSAVAAMPAKNLVIVAAIILVGVFFLYKVIFSGSAKDEKPQEKLPNSNLETITPPTINSDNPLPAIPSLPELPAMPSLPEETSQAPMQLPSALNDAPEPLPDFEETSPVDLAEEPTMMFSPAAFFNNNSAPAPVAQPNRIDNKAAQARRKSNIMVKSGGFGIGDANKTQTEAKTGFYVPEKSKFSKVNITDIGDTNFVIAQGKIIDAVLETAINTDLSGIARAIVSRDVYAESGKTVLIPKGSRLLAEYDSNVKRGQKRVLVSWKRVIRPDGIDIDLGDGIGIDQIGRAGVKGLVNNRYAEVLSNAILLSSFNVTWAKVSENLTKTGDNTRTTTEDKKNQTVTTTSTNSASDKAIQEGTDNIGNTVKNYIEEAMQVKPTINVDQGSKIKVFVNRDLIFPTGFNGKSKLLN